MISFIGIKRAIGKGKEPRSECPDIFLEAKINNAVPNNYDDTVFCAQNANEREASCEGDSGESYLKVNLVNHMVPCSMITVLKICIMVGGIQKICTS